MQMLRKKWIKADTKLRLLVISRWQESELSSFG